VLRDDELDAVGGGRVNVGGGPTAALVIDMEDTIVSSSAMTFLGIAIAL